VSGEAYDLSGAETLSYREMVGRAFDAVGLPRRFVTVPRWAVRAAIPILRLLPAFRGISLAMFDRMNEDMVFDHSAARRDLGFEPRPFRLPEGMKGGFAG
jgi:nucleoside-diphosphate-sugar epimerase